GRCKLPALRRSQGEGVAPLRKVCFARQLTPRERGLLAMVAETPLPIASKIFPPHRSSPCQQALRRLDASAAILTVRRFPACFDWRSSGRFPVLCNPRFAGL